MSPLPDEYKIATLVGGVAVCTFESRPYHRVFTNIVVTNGVASSVVCYRGIIGGIPVAQNPIGMNNTLTGRIAVPAGQQFFVQWSAAANPVSQASARISMETGDPLGDGSTGYQTWSVNAIDQITIGGTVGQPRTVIGVSPMPSELTAYYTAGAQNTFVPPETIISAIINYDGQSPENYAYTAYVIDSSTPKKIESMVTGHFLSGFGVREVSRIVINPNNQIDNTFFTGNKVSLIDKTGDAIGAVLLGGGHFSDINADRVQIGSDSTITFGPGGTNVATDSIIGRDAVGTLFGSTARGIDPTTTFGAETWHNATLTNAWTNFGSPYPVMRYRIVMAPYRCVQLLGVISSGTLGASIFTLPVGYRPDTHTIRAAAINSGAGPCIDVATTGTVTGVSLNAGVTAINCLIPMDG